MDYSTRIKLKKYFYEESKIDPNLLKDAKELVSDNKSGVIQIFKNDYDKLPRKLRKEIEKQIESGNLIYKKTYFGGTKPKYIIGPKSEESFIDKIIMNEDSSRVSLKKQIAYEISNSIPITRNLEDMYKNAMDGYNKTLKKLKSNKDVKEKNSGEYYLEIKTKFGNLGVNIFVSQDKNPENVDDGGVYVKESTLPKIVINLGVKDFNSEEEAYSNLIESLENYRNSKKIFVHEFFHYYMDHDRKFNEKALKYVFKNDQSYLFDMKMRYLTDSEEFVAQFSEIIVDNIDKIKNMNKIQLFRFIKKSYIDYTWGNKPHISHVIAMTLMLSNVDKIKEIVDEIYS